MSTSNQRNVLITGGTTGIGYAAAALFRGQGARVVITGQNRERLDNAVRQLGADVTGIQADQSKLADLDHLAEEAGRILGSIVVLVLNAGVSFPAGTADADEAHFDQQVAINLKGPFLTVQKLGPLLRDGGTIIANTSCLDQIGMPGMAVYSATKAVLRSMTRTWAAEFLPRNIRVNAVAPGPIETPIYGKFGLPAEQLNAMAADIQGQVPMRRFGEPDEVAGAMLFLAGAHAGYMTGQEIVLDGGWTCL